jgi:RimJ/RimL family protein N-acetyltransferase
VVTVRPLYAVVATGNAASRRVVETCGFSVTGPPRIGDDGVEEIVLRLD